MTLCGIRYAARADLTLILSSSYLQHAPVISTLQASKMIRASHPSGFWNPAAANQIYGAAPQVPTAGSTQSHTGLPSKVAARTTTAEALVKPPWRC
jgi:hypothetical protein